MNLELLLKDFKQPNNFQKPIKPLFYPEINEKALYNYFKECYYQINSKSFIETVESKLFVYTLIYYFKNKDNFYKSPLLYKLNGAEFSLDKGLCIIGGFGTGKSTILKTFRFMLNNIYKSKVPLLFETAIDIVHEYENLPQEDIQGFFDKYCNGFRIIDDLKSEKIASRFGQIDLFKEILFKRLENKRINTIITANYHNDEPDNMKVAIEELYRYEGRVYDRLYEKFNFIQLQDKSFRK
jgi:DNA replication protein DnaC